MLAKVFQYGITRMPSRLSDEAFNQAIKRHNLYNELIALDKQISEQWDAIVAASDSDLAAATERIEALEARLAETMELVGKSRSANKGKCSPEIAAEAKAIRGEIKAVRAVAKSRKAEARAKAKPLLDELEKKRQAGVKSAWQKAAADGVYWGNYNAACEEYKTARGNVLKRRGAGQACDLRFRRWDGSAAWTVQIQGGASWEDITTGRCQQVQIDAVPCEAWTSTVRGERRRLARTTGRIRLCSTDGKKPVWMEFPVTIHRPVPESARIKMAHVVRKKSGLRWEWHLNLVVTYNEPATKDGGGAKAVHLGFRHENGQIRVATVFDGDKYEAITIPDTIVSASDRVDRLRSLIDGKVDEVKAAITAWVKDNRGWIPDWLREQTASAHAWKAPARIIRLLDTWERFAGDEEIYGTLQNFRLRYRHLYQWQTDLYRKISLRRREAYRVAAKSIVDSASVIYMDDSCYADIKMRPNEEDSRANDVEAAVRRMASLASPGEFRAEVERCCAAQNVEAVRINPAHITRLCTVCDNTAKDGDLGIKPLICCPTCGTRHDRDNNAALNVWRRGEKDRSKDAA